MVQKRQILRGGAVTRMRSGGAGAGSAGLELWGRLLKGENREAGPGPGRWRQKTLSVSQGQHSHTEKERTGGAGGSRPKW